MFDVQIVNNFEKKVELSSGFDWDHRWKQHDLTVESTKNKNGKFFVMVLSKIFTGIAERQNLLYMGYGGVWQGKKREITLYQNVLLQLKLLERLL